MCLIILPIEQPSKFNQNVILFQKAATIALGGKTVLSDPCLHLYLISVFFSINETVIVVLSIFNIGP